MILVRFTGKGYKIIDSTKVVRLFEDKQHDLLFSYVFNKSLSELPNLLEQYVAKKMDITTFELNNYQYTEKDSEAINEILTNLHPYYLYEGKEVFVKMIGEYLNALLIKSSYHENQTSIFYPIYEKDWYVERFKELTDKYLRFDGTLSDMYYEKYREDICADKSFISLPMHILKQPANECISELITQQSVMRILYWLLDISTANMQGLAISQRIWLYASIFGTSPNRKEIAVTQHLSLMEPVQYIVGQDHTVQWEYSNKKYDMFNPLYGKLNSLHANSNDITSEALEVLNKTIEDLGQIPDYELYEEYEITDLYHLLFLEILKMIEENINIKKCKHCGQYFIVTNLNMNYCSRIADGEEKPCNIIGSKSTYDKLKNEPQLKLYNRAYKTHYARINGDTFTKEKFTEWRKKAKEKLGEARAGKLELSEFEKWLKK